MPSSHCLHVKQPHCSDAVTGPPQGFQSNHQWNLSAPVSPSPQTSYLSIGMNRLRLINLLTPSLQRSQALRGLKSLNQLKSDGGPRYRITCGRYRYDVAFLRTILRLKRAPQLRQFTVMRFITYWMQCRSLDSWNMPPEGEMAEVYNI